MTAAEKAPAPDGTLIGAKEIAVALSDISGREYTAGKIFRLSENTSVPIRTDQLGHSLTATRGALEAWWAGIGKPKEEAA